jgi:hypothetical protein
MSITFEEYKQQRIKSKIIKLSSGLEFKIRKLRQRDFLKTGLFKLENFKRMLLNNNSEIEESSMTDEQLQLLIENMDNVILAGVIEPELTKEDLDVLDDKDCSFIYQEIMNFSRGQDFKPFREESENADNSSSNGADVREIA